MQSGLSDLSKEDQMVQLVIFHVRTEEFAVPIDEIQEIIKLEKVTPIPDSPTFIKGIINVRGDIVTTIGMSERLFGEQDTESSARHIIITKQHDNVFGLVVDEVTEVIKVDIKEIKTQSHFISQVHQDYIKGTMVNEGRLFIILDLANILSDEEFARLAKTHAIQVEKPLDTSLEERKEI